MELFCYHVGIYVFGKSLDQKFSAHTFCDETEVWEIYQELGLIEIHIISKQNGLKNGTIEFSLTEKGKMMMDMNKL